MAIWWPDAHSESRHEQDGTVPVVRYETLAESGVTLNSGTETLNRLPKDLSCVVLVQPGEVSFVSVVPPPISGKKLRDSLPFLVEPHLLNDLEENFLGFWPDLTAAPDTALVSVIAKSRIRQIANQCRQFGLQMAGISCELLHDCKQPLLWTSDGFLLVADKLAPPLALDLQQTASVSALLGRRTRKLQEELGNESTWTVLPSDWEQLRPLAPEGTVVQKEAVKPSSIELLKKPLCTKDDLKKLGVSVNQSDALPYRQLTKAVAVFALVGIVGLNLLAFKVNQQEQALREEIETSFKQALPDTPMVADPLLLIDRAKRQLSEGTQTTNTEGVSYLFHEVGLALDNAPFNSLTELNWTDNQLTLTFNPNVTQAMQEEALNKLKGKPVNAKWVIGSGTNENPVLQVSWRAR